MDVVSPHLTGMGDEEGLFLASCVGDCRVLVIQFLTRSEGRLCGPRLLFPSRFCYQSRKEARGMQMPLEISVAPGEIDVNLASLVFAPCQFQEPH